MIVKQQQEFRYQSVAVELTMPNMRSDVVVRRGEAALLVEVAVRHPSLANGIMGRGEGGGVKGRSRRLPGRAAPPLGFR